MNSSLRPSSYMCLRMSSSFDVIKCFIVNEITEYLIVDWYIFNLVRFIYCITNGNVSKAWYSKNVSNFKQMKRK